MAMLPNPDLDWPISLAGVELIARRESCRLVAYRCPAGVPTCGWGETDGVTMQTVWTQDYADRRLADSLRQYAHEVRALCRVEPNAHELAALVSLAYNIGLGALARSSVLRAHNRGDRMSAARAFSLWNKARVGGMLTVLAGLTSRRAEEAALYLRPMPAALHAVPAPEADMPQAVEAESRMAASPVARTAAGLVATGTMTALTEATGTVAEVRQVVEPVHRMLVADLGVQPLVALGLLVAAAGAVVLYWRGRQRTEGWA